MSTSQVPQNAGATGDNESTEDEITIRTRLFYPLFGIAVIVGIILDVFILILLNTYVPGRARTPFWIFIIPIAVLVFLVSFIDDVLAKHFPNLVPEELRRQLAAAEAAKAAEVPQQQQQGYPQMPGNPMPAQAAPQQSPTQVRLLRSRATDSPSTDSRRPSRRRRRAPATARCPASRQLGPLRSRPRTASSSRARCRRQASTARLPRTSSPTVREDSPGRAARSATEARRAPMSRSE